MRLGEVLALEWKALDFERRQILVLQTLEKTRDADGRKVVRFKEPKTHRSERPLTMPQVLVDLRRQHRAAQAAWRLQLGGGYTDHGLVVAQDTGHPWTVKVISKAFEHLAQQAGCPEIRFHDLRHSHVSELLAAGVPLHVISARVGHARKSTTLDIYGHLLPGQDEEAAQAVDAAFSQAFRKPKTGCSAGFRRALLANR